MALDKLEKKKNQHRGLVVPHGIPPNDGHSLAPCTGAGRYHPAVLVGERQSPPLAESGRGELGEPSHLCAEQEKANPHRPPAALPSTALRCPATPGAPCPATGAQCTARRPGRTEGLVEALFYSLLPSGKRAGRKTCCFPSSL